METILLLALAGYILFKFNRPLTTAVKVVDKSANILDDTIDTYSNDVHIINAAKRLNQKTELLSLGEIVTNREITLLLNGKPEQNENTKTAE